MIPCGGWSGLETAMITNYSALFASQEQSWTSLPSQNTSSTPKVLFPYIRAALLKFTRSDYTALETWLQKRFAKQQRSNVINAFAWSTVQFSILDQSLFQVTFTFVKGIKRKNCYRCPIIPCWFTQHRTTWKKAKRFAKQQWSNFINAFTWAIGPFLWPNYTKNPKTPKIPVLGITSG